MCSTSEMDKAARLGLAVDRGLLREAFDYASTIASR